MKLLMIILLSFTFLIGCNDETEVKPNFSFELVSVDSNGDESFTHYLGEQVSFRLQLKNLDNRDWKLKFSPPISDLKVYKDGEHIWTWSSNKLFAAEVLNYEIAKHASDTFWFEWDQMQSNTEQMGTGEYEVQAEVWLFNGEQLISYKVNSKFSII